jgi:hypothetical protein
MTMTLRSAPKAVTGLHAVLLLLICSGCNLLLLLLLLLLVVVVALRLQDALLRIVPKAGKVLVLARVVNRLQMHQYH